MSGATELYRARRERFGAEAERLAGRSGRLANLRLVTFLAAFACGGWGLFAGAPLLAAVAALLLAGFVGLVVYHRRIERTRRRAAGLARINEEAGHRLARDWARLPLHHAIVAEVDHAYAADLDLLGRASLMHLMDTVGTLPGEWTLGGWLLRPADPATVRERQAAVAELAPLVELRDELTWRGLASGETRIDPTPFLAWAEGGPWLAERRGLLWAARIGPPVLWILAAGQLLGFVGHPLWLIPLLVNLWLARALVGPARRTIEQVASLSAGLPGYAAALEVFLGQPFRAAALRRPWEALVGADASAPELLHRLHRVITLAQPSSSQLYPLIELATLWNVHVLWALERWQATAGPRVRAWLEALGQVEALAALARLAHDNPGWAFPEVVPSATALAARDLGHPLLPVEARVDNDLEVGPRGTFLLVTGSNMSGKSTLLRAIGLNVVLAQAGGPVCAAALRLPPLAPWTSMRVQDSLERGVSFFMAELQRLKQIVDATQALTLTSTPTPATRPLLLYLLDEILQGTNTAERQIAARRVVRLLLARPAIGVVSTHDLTLADAPDLAAAVRAVHLTETVANGAAGPRMSFDYRLRPGIARSTNALRLMELVGLPSE